MSSTFTLYDGAPGVRYTPDPVLGTNTPRKYAGLGGKRGDKETGIRGSLNGAVVCLYTVPYKTVHCTLCSVHYQEYTALCTRNYTEEAGRQAGGSV